MHSLCLGDGWSWPCGLDSSDGPKHPWKPWYLVISEHFKVTMNLLTASKLWGGCPFLVGSIHIFVGCTNSPSIWIWIDCMSSWFFVLFRTKQLPPYPFWMETLAHFVASLDGNSCSQIGLMTFPHHSASHSKVSRFEPE